MTGVDAGLAVRVVLTGCWRCVGVAAGKVMSGCGGDAAASLSLRRDMVPSF